jgi:hypothetical protein
MFQCSQEQYILCVSIQFGKGNQLAHFQKTYLNIKQRARVVQVVDDEHHVCLKIIFRIQGKMSVLVMMESQKNPPPSCHPLHC